MALFRRRRRERPPAEVTALLDPDELVVSWADTDDGPLVATNRGVWWPFPDGHRRMGWQHIDKAVWRDGVLLVVEADVLDDELLIDRPPVRAALTVPRDLPPVVRKRVEANVVKSELLSVAGGAVRFVARRQPGQDGVTWWARLEPGTRVTPEIRSAIAARLAILRSEAVDSRR